MLARLRSHLTFANVVSSLALFIALGGGAYALTIPKNSVGARQLKKNAVLGSKIKRGAVTSPTVKDHSLLSKDFQPGQLPAGATGPKGSVGPPGSARALREAGACSWPARRATDPCASSSRTRMVRLDAFKATAFKSQSTIIVCFGTSMGLVHE